MDQIIRPKGYPRTSFGIIVCWHCRKGNKQLFNIRDEDGFKTPDYICVDCKGLAPKYPPLKNVSIMYFPKKKTKKKNIAIEADVIK